eukprot:XP_011674476.1 PREDICTED: uncharacterized protein LOC754362 [Strongylocentrotus purpuratus]
MIPIEYKFPETPTRLTFNAIDSEGNLAVCDVIVHVTVFRCPRLQAPFHGSVVNCSVSPVYGSHCSFSCDEGYDLVGSETRTCELSGDYGPASWTGTEPVCQAKKCEALATPENAVKSGCINNPPNTEDYGTQCIFYCLYGFEGVGDSSSICQADETWTRESFNCIPASCKVLEAPDEGSVTPEECSMAPVFGQSCVVSCNPGYQLDPPNFSVLSCQGNGKWAPGNLMGTTCKDIQSPSFSPCPQNLPPFIARREETLVNVTWNITATDNSGKKPTIVCDNEPGLMEEGDFEVRCTATDDDNNVKTCTFDVAVQVHKCRPYVLPSFAEFAGECDTIWGAECNITCNPGYHLTGSSTVTCEVDGSKTRWTAQTTPRCEAIQCNHLELPEHVNINPSLCAGPVNVSVGTMCTPYCPTGRHLQGDGSPIVCESDGQWNRFINASSEDLACLDITAPILTLCPSPIPVTRTEAWGVQVSFTPPTATDSLDGSSLIVTTSPSDLTSPYNVTQDTTFIYTFSDNAGNQVNCSFPIYVQDELSPVLVSCPNDTEELTSQQETEVTWDPPEFFEPTGDQLDISCNYDNGTATLAINQNHLIECRATNQDNGKTTTCSFIISVKSKSCRGLDPPENGALACDGWSDGKFCDLFCNDKFDVPIQGFDNQYVCGLSGIWIPNDIIPDCTESRRGRRINLPSELFYFSGSCGTSETQLAIAAAFLESFQSSSFGGSCTEDDECTVNNVRVTCGPSSRRRRKRRSRRRQMDTPVDLGTWEEHMHFQHLFSKIRKRSALNFEIVIGFYIETNLMVDVGQTDYDAALDAEEKMIGLVETLIEGGQLDLSSSVDNFTAVLDESSFNYEYVELVCAPPYTVNNDIYRCVPCGRGSYYGNETQECMLCEVGTYQDTHGEFTCHQCPEGQSTIGVGSKNVTQCIDICQPGYSSFTGLAPCNHCPIGSYQEEFFATECTSCPVGTTTLNKGSTSSLKCNEFCAAGEYSPSGFVPCMPCPLGTYQSGTQRSTCHQCPGETTTMKTGSTDASMCVDIDECESQPCQHDASCLDGINSFTCICGLGYTGSTCGDQILPCDSDPCLNGASCVDEVNQFTCMCAPGYTGSVCETEIDYCDPRPCKNNATCKSSQGHFECFCLFGFDGETCSNEIDYCVDTPCQNSASCVISELSAAGYKCICAEGYTGENCSSNIDECKSSPCLNDGNCTDGINSFTCSCTTGYNGFICDDDIDLCADWNCQNGGTCKDLGKRAVCACPKAYAGQFCDEVRTACSDSPCINGGTCTAVDDTTLAFDCTCTEGYIGQTCETEVNFCQPDPCRNGATCEDQPTTYICHCPDGFTGKTCAQDISWCDDNPCGLNATCIEEPLSFRCLCDVSYSGERCEEVLTVCDAQDPCLNGATCSGDSLTFQCQCPPAYQGLLCEHEINPCATSPCLNGGTCVKDLQSYRCDCAAGFEGIHCEGNQDECASEPCEHGTCIDGINSFSCDCEAGYTGHTCSEDKFCDANPCQNGGSCENLNTKYRCSCAPGFRGRTCSRQIDYCRRNPCTSGNTVGCENVIGSYTCVCKDGFTGLECESEINECEMSPSPCKNDGRCINQWGTFTCQCQVGFTGNLCDINIDDCVSHGCESGASCVDGINSYSCLCTEGRYGLWCQLKLTPCDNNPCYNGGVCTVNRDGFLCECLSGFTGPSCEVDIDDCVNHRCASGSTCEDQWDSYSCICPQGITGDLCDQEIDDCLCDPCQHGATCIDGRSSITCTCTSGFMGKFCEVDIMECSSDPCVNFGTCIEGTDRFDCQCAEGYRGTTCKEFVSSCVSNPCKYNGTCTDGFMQYMCTCAAGYTGDTCETVIPDNYDLRLNDQMASISFSASVVDGSPNLTLSFWVKVQMAYPNKQLLDMRIGNFKFSVQNPCGLAFIQTGENSSSSTLSVCDDGWHHMLLVFRDSGRWSAAVDGSHVMSQDDDSRQYNLSGTMHLYFGTDELEQGDSIYMTGINVWNGYVSDDVLSRVTSECLPQLYGNIISWTDFDSHQAFPTTSSTPSMCDDTDECESLTPCQNGGTCVDKLRSYTCLCLEDYEGINCEKFIDLCNNESCENGGSCATVNRTTHCSCPDRFFGEFCELEIINGGWSNWLPWSPCSVPCEGGTRNTSRECTNPPPNDYGQPCHGENTKQEPCNIQDCPGCIRLQAPENATLNCWSEGETKKCTVSCNSPDMSFLRPVESEYSCSPESDYKWNHENEYNRRASLPACKETMSPDAVEAKGTFAYPGANCDSDEDQENLMESFKSTYSANSNGIGCKKCALSNVQVNNCGSSRKKRASEDLPITISFTVNINDTDSNTTVAESFDALDTGFENLLENGSFSLMVNGELISVDLNQSTGDVSITCPQGSGLSDNANCVTCSVGNFAYIVPNTTAVLCIPCLLHTYQDQEGQAECTPCPAGLITNDPGADDISYCIEPCPLGHYQDVWSDPSNTTCIQCPLDTYQNETGQESCFPCPTGYITLEPGATNASDCVAVCNAGHYVDLSNKTNPQCPPCLLNTFLDLDVHQEQECIPCAPGMITIQNGSSQSTDCLVSCMPGSYLESSSCTPCPLNTYQDQTNHREESCILCPSNLITLNESSDSLANCTDPQERGSPFITGRNNLVTIVVIVVVVILVLLVISLAVASYYKKKNNRYTKRSSSITPTPHLPMYEIEDSRESSNPHVGIGQDNVYTEQHGFMSSSCDQVDNESAPYCQTPVENFRTNFEVDE